MEMIMDYKILLKKFISHIYDVTDDYHLDTLNMPNASIYIDRDEERELFEIQQEIENETETSP